jgi:hypothetical protein
MYVDRAVLARRAMPRWPAPPVTRHGRSHEARLGKASCTGCHQKEAWRTPAASTGGAWPRRTPMSRPASAATADTTSSRRGLRHPACSRSTRPGSAWTVTPTPGSPRGIRRCPTSSASGRTPTASTAGRWRRAGWRWPHLQSCHGTHSWPATTPLPRSSGERGRDLRAVPPGDPGRVPREHPRRGVAGSRTPDLHRLPCEHTIAAPRILRLASRREYPGPAALPRPRGWSGPTGWRPSGGRPTRTASMGLPASSEIWRRPIAPAATASTMCGRPATPAPAWPRPICRRPAGHVIQEQAPGSPRGGCTSKDQEGAPGYSTSGASTRG